MTEILKLIPLEDRKAKALHLRSEGYNCAQTVIMVFPDITHLDDDTAARMSMALGAGVGGTGEICGVANGMAIVEGLAGGSDPALKGATMKRAGELIRAFSAANNGCVNCRDLKGKCHKSCNDLILDGIEILHNHFASITK